MNLFVIKGGKPVLLNSRKMIRVADGAGHDYVAVSNWPAVEREALGVYEGTKATAAGVQIVSREWVWTGTAVVETLVTEPLPPEPTRQERFDQSAGGGNSLTDALIAGLAEVKGITVPEAKVWLRGLL